MAEGVDPNVVDSVVALPAIRPLGLLVLLALWVATAVGIVWRKPTELGG